MNIKVAAYDMAYLHYYTIIYEGLDGVYWLLINGLIFCWLLILA